MIVRAGYVNGETRESDTEDWSDLPADGVDFVELTNDAGSVRVSGHSLYWLYREGPNWVIGGGSIGYTNPLGETLVSDGNHEYREIEYLPDLNLGDVKLGAWWPGKERPPHG